MSIFDKIKHAFAPVAREIHDFNPQHVVDGIEHAIEAKIRGRLPNHLSLHEAVEVVKIAQPDRIDIDVFVGFGVELGIELDMEFDVGVSIEEPVRVIGAIVDLVENPPETTHQLLDRLWTIIPSEVRVYERLQAIVGEQVQVAWTGEGVMDRVCTYVNRRGWLEKRLRPS